jgi:23S rRNA (uridine2552-2'-O)-methyltransferase
VARSKSSGRWLREHFEDEYVKRAQREGWRSRGAFKLVEIDARDRLIRPGMTVLDLGAAPGGWSQYASKRLAGRGRVLALDLLAMDPLPGVEFVQGDFCDVRVLERLFESLGQSKAHLVLSDMAPNISGVKAVDQPRIMYLAELAAEFAAQTLGPGGNLLVKVFQGDGFDQLLRELRRRYASVVSRKPQASRARSRELYLLARNYRL